MPPAVAIRLSREWRVADDPEAAETVVQPTSLAARDRGSAGVARDPQARPARLRGTGAEGFLEKLVVREVAAAELVLQALVHRGCRGLEGATAVL